MATILPVTYPITIFRNSSNSIDLKLGFSDNSARSLVGTQVRCQITQNRESPQPRILGSMEVQILNAAQGSIRLTIPRTLSVKLPRTCYYDLLVVTSEGTNEYWLEGTLTVLPSVSR